MTVVDVQNQLKAIGFFSQEDVSSEIIIESNSLLLTFKSHGDLPVVLSISEDQITVQTVLVERDEFKDPAKIDYMLLSTHQILPLSTISIQKIKGADWYVLFGALSTNSKPEVIAEELRQLVKNTFNVIDSLEADYKFNVIVTNNSQGDI